MLFLTSNAGFGLKHLSFPGGGKLFDPITIRCAACFYSLRTARHRLDRTLQRARFPRDPDAIRCRNIDKRTIRIRIFQYEVRSIEAGRFPFSFYAWEEGRSIVCSCREDARDGNRDPLRYEPFLLSPAIARYLFHEPRNDSGSPDRWLSPGMF